MSQTYFVTGTDTGVGKTLVTAALLELAVRQGKRAFGLKPVAAGCREVDGQWLNDDALLLQRHSNVELPYATINPVALKAPLAPHIAASHEGRRLQVKRLEGFVRGALMQQADLRLLEGAGGWRVPIAPGEFLSDVPKLLGCPVVLVVGLRLGCLNHALLTAEAILRDGLPFAGWVANSLEPDMPAEQDNVATLGYLLPGPCLGHIPFMPNPQVATAADHLVLPP